jgi:prepilin signal peptidase PulO-like enzyme (type II secretory pathway)
MGSFLLSAWIHLTPAVLGLSVWTLALAAAIVPPGLGVALLFAGGLLAGGLINLGVCALAWEPSAISPWLPAPAGWPGRTWADRIPLWGWLRLRRESAAHGRAFWVRPLLVELLTGVGCVLLYWLEVRDAGLLPAMAALGPAPPDQLATANLTAATHCTYAAHVVLILLMAVASLIDIDEQLIPDAITVPGTLVGLVLALVYPWSLLPARAWTDGLGQFEIGFLHIAAPNPWPAALDGWSGLVLAWACWWPWCVALAAARWYGRHGWRRAAAIATARLMRDPMIRLAPIGTLLIGLAWWLAPQAHWAGLVTALVGMAVGGGIIWAVRIVGSAILAQEAMGFGDVTLLAMIGAFLGWQTCPLIFFLAPLAGVVIGVAQRMLHGDRHIPYGPFLCLAALAIIVAWRTVWLEVSPAFAVGWLVPAGLAACLILLAVLLGLWMILRRLLFGK